MEQTKKKRENFLNKVYSSLTNFDKYIEYSLETVSKPIIYLLKISLLVSIILTSILTYVIYKNEVTFINNILSFKETYNFEFRERKIIIDTYTDNEDEILNYKNEAGLYNNSLILLKDKALIKIQDTNFDFEYKDLIADTYFDKSMIIEYSSVANLFYLAINVFIFVTIHNFFKYLFTILIFSVFGMFLKYMLRLNLKYSHVFNICVYAYTLPIFLELIFSIINILFGFKIYKLDLMIHIIFYIYVLAAMISIRSNIIRAQIEFAKLKMSMNKNSSQDINKDKEDKK